MDRLKRNGLWGKKKPRLEEEKAGSERQQILPSEAPGNLRQQHKGRPPKLARWIAGFPGRWPGNKGPRNVFHLTETSKGFLELVQDGRFQEACQSISTLEEEGQDCGPHYEAVARSMWQVVQQALDGTGPSQELEQKLQAVLATVEWAQDQHERWEASAAQDGGVATWAGQLNKLLRNDAETRVPTLGPRDQLDLYLEKLDKAVRQGLGSPRASRLGTCLWEVYRTYFHEVLLGRLSKLTQSCGANLKSCQVLYTWGKTNLFEQPGRETLAKVRRTSQEPVVGHLLDPLMFVTWMSQVQQMLVGLIQEMLRKRLDRVLVYDLKESAQCSYPRFLDVFQVRTCLHPPSLPHGGLGPFLRTWPGEGGWLTGGGALLQQGWVARGGRAPGIEASDSEGRQGRAAGHIFWGGASSWNVSTHGLAWASGRTCTGTAVWGRLRERVEPYWGEGYSAQEEERPPACVVVVKGGTRWRVQGREAWKG
ncbi:unnamed protein product [Gulo gulo]|uniref:Uncharacterized protein n=1 Tax=Gulo gulo TaxID=48420 RepID=A0A9X9LC24_GULGU|nr:unnamed protein product [Gulo gulo]